jgi:hypothetical protein
LKEDASMEIVRNDDGSLVVPVEPPAHKATKIIGEVLSALD